MARPETLATRDKSTSVSGIKNENISSKELAEELHKPIIRKFKERKLYLRFIDNNLGCGSCRYAFNNQNSIKKFVFYYVIDIFSKYAWVIPLKGMH